MFVFVIHTTLPKTLDSYYQESGRVGRYGQVTHCLLFYSNSDIPRMRNSFHCPDFSKMVDYCKDKRTCRSAMQLIYLVEEEFDPKICRSNPNTACDNCGG